MSRTDLAKIRENIITKYSTTDNIDDTTLQASLINIDDPTIFDETFIALYDKFTPRASVYLSLTKKYSATEAKAIIRVVDNSMSNSLDMQREINYSLHQVDTHISTLRDIINKAANGEEGYIDIDVSSLYPELRQWLTFRVSIVNNVQTNLLTDKKLNIEAKKVDKMNKPGPAVPMTQTKPDGTLEEVDLTTLSTEELEKLLGGQE
jgi:hypothetical protein